MYRGSRGALKEYAITLVHHSCKSFSRKSTIHQYNLLILSTELGSIFDRDDIGILYPYSLLGTSKIIRG